MGPRVHLAIDNCFAAKRWCEVGEWMGIVSELGIRCVEASADNEIDPLYSTDEHVKRWIDSVLAGGDEAGVRVVNCYSGHGTYSTLGLAHHDASVRSHIKDDWFKRMISTAGALGAGIGFFAHAFSEKVLRDRAEYDAAFDRLIGDIRELAIFAASADVVSMGVEQMYTPHQVPWTIGGTDEFLVRANRANREKAGLPVYITLDTGHQSAQARFLPPTEDAVASLHAAARAGERSNVYLGPREHYARLADMVRGGAGLAEFRTAVDAHVEENPHLFSKPGDAGPRGWFRRFGCYSPIVHLQQTDGTSSSHLCFTPEHNRKGIIRAEDVLADILECARAPRPDGFPPKVEDVYLTLEPFLGTASHPRAMLEDIADSVSYWREFVPEDGVEIDALVS